MMTLMRRLATRDPKLSFKQFMVALYKHGYGHIAVKVDPDFDPGMTQNISN